MDNILYYVKKFDAETAIKMKTSADKVYDALTGKSSILQNYIIPNYEVLHTQDKEYIVDDIMEVMKEQGVCQMILYHGSDIEIRTPA